MSKKLGGFYSFSIEYGWAILSAIVFITILAYLTFNVPEAKSENEILCEKYHYTYSYPSTCYSFVQDFILHEYEIKNIGGKRYLDLVK